MLYLLILINFVFIGFGGRGNQELKLGPGELERWFVKIDHVFKHTRVPQLREALTPFYKLKDDRVHHHHLPLIALYRCSQLQPKRVFAQSIRIESSIGMKKN